jgi:hypothetical protein
MDDWRCAVLDRMGMSLVPILGTVVWLCAVSCESKGQRRVFKAIGFGLLMVAFITVINEVMHGRA